MIRACLQPRTDIMARFADLKLALLELSLTQRSCASSNTNGHDPALTMVGAAVGFIVRGRVGASVGAALGFGVGAAVGATVGACTSIIKRLLAETVPPCISATAEQSSGTKIAVDTSSHIQTAR